MTRKKQDKSLENLKPDPVVPESEQEEIRGGFITYIPGMRPPPPPPPPPTRPPVNERTPPSLG